MPIYCTNADVSSKMPKLSQVQSLTSTAIDGYIEEVEAELNTRLADMYNVPFRTDVSSFPPVIKEITKTKTILTILDDNVMHVGERMMDWMESRMKRVDDLIDKIAAGSATLVTSAGNAIAKKLDTEVWGTRSDFHPIFDVAILAEESIIDSDLRDEELDERGL